MAASRPGNAERGWNDPPLFFYSAQTTAPKSPSRSPLHKRVAHPGITTAQPPGGATTSGSPLLLPPTTGQTTLLVPPPISDVKGQSSTQTTSSTGTIHGIDLSTLNLSNEQELFDHVTCMLNKVIDDCCNTVHKRVVEDVKKKLGIMRDSWPNLPLVVKQRMAALATALNRRECDAAHEIHLSLMVDYTSQVNLWMVGVKRLILEARKVPRTSAENDTNNAAKTDCSPCPQKESSTPDGASETEPAAESVNSDTDTQTDNTVSTAEVCDTKEETETEREAEETANQNTGAEISHGAQELLKSAQ